MRRPGPLTLLCVSLLSCGAGCTVGPDFVRPNPPVVETYAHGTDPTATINADGQAQRFEQGSAVASDWWLLFGSPELDTVIREALENSPTLESAEASLRRSHELLRAGSGLFYPQIDAVLDVTRQKSSQARFGGSSESRIFSLYTATATVSYALDLFGANRRAVEGLEAQVDLQRYQLMGAYLTLSGNIVNAVVTQAATREQVRATEEIIALQREQVRLAGVQAEAGTVPYSAVLNLRSQLSATEATLPLLRQRLSQTEHLIAILTGHTPAEWAPPEIELSEITLPADLPLSLPSELVRRRPDILAAEARLHAASAEIGIATAALYPNITLSGAYGYNNSALKHLFRNSSSFWSMGADLLAPIFHGGSLQAQRRAAVEGYRQSLADYRQTVLSAFGQVADTLRALEHDAEGLQAHSRALETSEEALRLVRANYKAGIADYIQLLITNSQYHLARIAYLQAKAQRLQDSAALFVALGGGWREGEEMISASAEQGQTKED